MVVGNVQIRLFTGEAVTQKFSVREPLAAVRLFAHSKIAGGQIDGDIGALTFATAFPPRRVFTEEDMLAPLNELGSTVFFTYLFIKFHLFLHCYLRQSKKVMSLGLSVCPLDY